MALLLGQVLPPTFEDLQRPFAVGVVDKGGSHRVVSSGPLSPAVAASAAVPVVFRPVSIPGECPESQQRLLTTIQGRKSRAARAATIALYCFCIRKHACIAGALHGCGPKQLSHDYGYKWEWPAVHSCIRILRMLHMC